MNNDIDNLFMIASELIENNNYEKDTFQNETKPDGEYSVVIESIKLKQSESTGTQWFDFVLKVIDGEYIEEKFYVKLYLSEKTIQSSIAKIMRLIKSVGYQLDREMFNNLETILNSLQPLVGETVILTKETTKKGFINYSFKGEEYEN